MIDIPKNPECSGTCQLPRIDDRFSTTVQEYIEVIRDLTHDLPVARVGEIAQRRGVKASSVSIALGVLRELGLIDHQSYGYVQLTEAGKSLGAVLSRRHEVINRFLKDILGLEPEIADQEACRLEHTMSGEMLDALVNYVSRVEGCPWCHTRTETQVKH
jgi:DtxR family Mn-dependent transcriptional regulator